MQTAKRAPAPVSSAEPIVGILLAAGSGRRYGGDKLMQPLADGVPLACRAARVLASACNRTLAVVAAGSAPALESALRELGVEVVVAADASRGMGHTLARGVDAASDAGGWVIALADMPAIRVDTMQCVARSIRAGASIAAPFHGGRRGHPVGFARDWRDALRALDGDSGARAVLAANAERITHLDVDDPGVLLDIYTPADLAAFVSA